jgi:hypothetical protein
VSDVHEEADEANANEESSGGESSRPAWMQGDPDVDRLVAYADNLRNTRAELQDKLAKAEAWDDEDAVYQKVSEKFPHWLEDGSSETDDDDEFEDDPREQELSELRERTKNHDEWIAQQQAQEFKRDFNKHVSELCGDEIELDDEDREFILQRSLSDKAGPGPDATERAFKWLTSRYTAREQAALERVTSSKRAPHVSAGGKAGKGPQPDMDTIEGRKAFYDAKLSER